jgi:hypothetical protein
MILSLLGGLFLPAALPLSRPLPDADKTLGLNPSTPNRQGIEYQE